VDRIEEPSRIHMWIGETKDPFRVMKDLIDKRLGAELLDAWEGYEIKSFDDIYKFVPEEEINRYAKFITDVQTFVAENNILAVSTSDILVQPSQLREDKDFKGDKKHSLALTQAKIVTRVETKKVDKVDFNTINELGILIVNHLKGKNIVFTPPLDYQKLSREPKFDINTSDTARLVVDQLVCAFNINGINTEVKMQNLSPITLSLIEKIRRLKETKGKSIPVIFSAQEIKDLAIKLLISPNGLYMRGFLDLIYILAFNGKKIEGDIKMRLGMISLNMIEGITVKKSLNDLGKHDELFRWTCVLSNNERTLIKRLWEKDSPGEDPFKAQRELFNQFRGKGHPEAEEKLHKFQAQLDKMIPVNAKKIISARLRYVNPWIGKKEAPFFKKIEGKLVSQAVQKNDLTGRINSEHPNALGLFTDECLSSVILGITSSGQEVKDLTSRANYDNRTHRLYYYVDDVETSEFSDYLENVTEDDTPRVVAFKKILKSNLKYEHK